MPVAGYNHCSVEMYLLYWLQLTYYTVVVVAAAAVVSATLALSVEQLAVPVS